jgi:hypothetical protein
MAFRVPLILAFFTACAGSLQAQRTITLHHVEISGTVVQVVPRGVVLKSATGKEWGLKMDKETSIKVTGTADPAMLTPGTCVRFTATIDKRTSKAQDKLDQITIFTESAAVADRTLGVERAGSRPQAKEGPAMPGQPRGPGGPPGGRGPGRPGAPGQPGQGQAQPAPGEEAPPEIAPDPAPVDDGAGKLKSPKRRGKGPDKSVPDVAAYEVCAQIVSCHNGRLTVNVQNRFLKSKITAELAADAKIDLDLGNLSVVKPGDKISGEGFYLNEGICEKTLSVEVALANPLLPPGSRARRPRPVAKGDASHKPAGKTKPDSETAAKKKAGAAAPAEKDPEKAPDKAPAELEVPPDLPSDQNAPAKPDPDESKPSEKKSVKKPEIPQSKEDKDVFEK